MNTGAGSKRKDFAPGFSIETRNGSMHCDFAYDMSVPNVAHLDPQRGGCCTVMPYFIGKILEIPVTDVQDYTLFNILEDFSIELWKKQTASHSEPARSDELHRPPRLRHRSAKPRGIRIAAGVSGDSGEGGGSLVADPAGSESLVARAFGHAAWSSVMAPGGSRAGQRAGAHGMGQRAEWPAGADAGGPGKKSRNVERPCGRVTGSSG